MNNSAPRIPSNLGRGTLAQVTVNTPEIESVMSRLNGEFPVDGDMSRLKWTRWTEFRTPSVWTYSGVNGRRSR